MSWQTNFVNVRIPIMKAICIILVLTFSFGTMLCQEKVQTSSANITNTIAVYAGPKFGYGSSDFSESYLSYFGGKNNQYNAKLAFGASFKFEPFEGVRFGFLGEYAQTGFTDIYKQLIKPHKDSASVGERSIEQQFAVTSYPILLTAEVVPSKNQFRTYIGAGLGVGIANVSWKETLNSSLINDLRTGGDYVNDTYFAPAFTLYTGIELGFDKKAKQSIFAGVQIEARYIYTGVSAPLFEKAKKQFVSAPSSWSESVYVGASAFAINVGVFFQLTKQHDELKK